MLYTGLFLASMAYGVARPAVAFYVRYDLESSMLAAASLTSGFSVGRGLASLVSGVLGEALPRLRWAVVELGLASASLLLIFGVPGAPSPLAVVVLMGVWGIISGLVWPSLQVVTSELGGRRSGTALSIYFALGSLGISLGNWLFGLLPYSPLVLVRLSGLLLVAGAAMLVYPSLGSRRYGGGGFGRALSRVMDPVILWVILAAFSLGFLNGVLREYFYLYAHEVYGVSRRGLGDILLAAGVASVLAGLLAGVLADMHSIPAVLVAVVGASAVSSLALGYPAVGILGMAIAYVMASAGVRASMPLTRNAALAGDVGGSLVVGASNALFSFGMTIGPLLAGILYETGRELAGVPFTLSGLLLIATLLVYAYIRLGRHRKST